MKLNNALKCDAMNNRTRMSTVQQRYERMKLCTDNGKMKIGKINNRIELTFNWLFARGNTVALNGARIVLCF